MCVNTQKYTLTKSKIYDLNILDCNPDCYSQVILPAVTHQYSIKFGTQRFNSSEEMRQTVIFQDCSVIFFAGRG